MHRYYTKEGSSIKKYPEILELLKSEDIYQTFIESGNIKMVGSYMFADGSVWYSFPKFYPVDTDRPTSKDLDLLDMIIKAIEKLRANGKNLFEGDRIFAPEARLNSKQKVNIIELSKYIVNDYMQHGIYTRKEMYYTKQGVGKNTWNKTIKKECPIIDVDIIYHKIWKKHVEADTRNIISQIHTIVVREAIRLYEKMHSREKIKSPEKTDISLCDGQNLKDFIPLLNAEMLHVYSDREQAVIKSMIAWCDLTYNYKFAGCTNCFQNVWEWVNDEVFGNQKKKESDLPEYYILDDKEGKKKFFGKGQAKPDTIFFGRNSSTGCLQLHIYDSKYYVPQFSNTKEEVYGFPPNSDIIKQVAYLRRIRSSMKPYVTEEVETKNIFLVPELTEEELSNIGRTKGKGDFLFEEIGYVNPANFDLVAKTLVNSINVDINIEIEYTAKENERVYIYMVYCSHLFEAYLKNNKYIPS